MRHSGVLASVALAALLGLTISPAGVRHSDTQTANHSETPLLGVLEANPSYISSDSHAGIRLATINLDWAEWEPSDGVVNYAYADSVEQDVARYRAAHWEVAIDPGLQQPPSWALSLPNGLLLDQDFSPATTADFEFSSAVRQAARAYLSYLVGHLGPVNYYRVGLSENGEMHYPDTTSNQWWAFTPSAQGTAGGLPPGVHVTPMPGWKPGAADWRKHKVTTAQVTRWYDWYFGAMVNAQAWEIASYRRAGYHGELELVMPGTGALPGSYAARIAHDLAPSASEDAYFTLNTGAVWWKLLNELPSLKGATLDISSVYDESGSPRGNGCEPADASVNYRVDPVIDRWSDTRWLAYLANRHHLPVVGETPGYTRASGLVGVFHLVETCHLRALQWAWEYELHGHGPTASLPQLSLAYHATLKRLRDA